MNSYYSAAYMALFLPLTVLMYQLMPQKKRWLVLLAASYLFFYAISGKLVLFILFSSFSIHHIGLWLDHLASLKEPKKVIMQKKRKVLTFAIILHLGLLVGLKYTPFFIANLNQVIDYLGFPLQIHLARYALPIGISFYTLQAVSYMVDVYRGKIQADTNLGRLCLFLAFFPQIMEGPICRYEQTALQLYEGRSVTYHQLTFGLQRILYGTFKKMVIADRLNPLIQTIFANYQDFSGEMILVGAVAFTLQLYMEFSGTMDVVIGSAEIFGIQMPENFRQPFFSRSISEFWKRWHITLGSWFKDYVFYPVAMSKKSKKWTLQARKKIGPIYGPILCGGIALFAVWICNGFWHGTGWNYLFFGIYHFILIFAGSLVLPLSRQLTKKWHIDREHWLFQGIQIGRTFVLVCVGELFFHANGLRAGLAMFWRMLTTFSFTSFTDGTLFNQGVDAHDFVITLFSLILVCVISLLKEREVRIRQSIATKPLPVRWACYYGLILLIVIFGAYGYGYIPVDPMYANF